MTCKQCGAELQVIPGGECRVNEEYVDRYAPRVGPLPRRTRPAGRVLACTGCDFIEEAHLCS